MFSSGTTSLKRQRGASVSSVISISSDSDDCVEIPTKPRGFDQIAVPPKKRQWTTNETSPAITSSQPADESPTQENDSSERTYDIKHQIQLSGITDVPSQTEHALAEQEAPVPPVPVPPEPEIELCEEQQDLVDLIVSGRNVFYTGSAGCGKSTVLKAAVKKLRSLGHRVHIIAPTGLAALQIGGVSTWSYMGWTPDFHKLTYKKLVSMGFRHHIKKRIKETDVLIIDEISMVENHHLQRISDCLAHVRHFDDPMPPPFGGIQMIVTGDFCQLPPVKPFQFCISCGKEMKLNEEESEFDCPERHGPFLESDKWAFRSRAWEEAKFAHVHLRKIHRQKDETFIKMLQKCRLGIPLSLEETTLMLDHPCQTTSNTTQLLCTRREVAAVNFEKYYRLKSPQYHYKALDGFRWDSEMHPQLRHYNNRFNDGTLEVLKDSRLEVVSKLRTGMSVILQINLDLDAKLCNGSQGIIFGFEPYDAEKLPKRPQDNNKFPEFRAENTILGDHAALKESKIREFAEFQQVKAWPRVLFFHTKEKRTIFPTCVVNSVGDTEPYSLLYRTQIPLVAGWALSVHKSQGMTLDRVIVNLARAFEEGQVYVALSRARNLEGLKVVSGSGGFGNGIGANKDVQTFLRKYFGEDLFKPR